MVESTDTATPGAPSSPPRATRSGVSIALLLKQRNLNVLGRYGFTASVAWERQRPLRAPDAVPFFCNSLAADI